MRIKNVVDFTAVVSRFLDVLSNILAIFTFTFTCSACDPRRLVRRRQTRVRFHRTYSPSFFSSSTEPLNYAKDSLWRKQRASKCLTLSRGTHVLFLMPRLSLTKLQPPQDRRLLGPRDHLWFRLVQSPQGYCVQSRRLLRSRCQVWRQGECS
jgi:hypothetical protein